MFLFDFVANNQYNLIMFKLFKRKPIEKESNIASTPEPLPETKEKWSKIQVFFLFWNLISITIYSAFTFFVIYNLSINTFLSKMIKWVLLLYGIAFLLLIVINLGNKKRMSRQLKNYKSATNFLKYFIQTLNFILSIATAIHALIITGTTDFSAVMWAIVSFTFTVINILFEVVKIIIRRNFSAIKQNFLDIREKPRKSFWAAKLKFREIHKLDNEKSKNKNIENAMPEDNDTGNEK